MNLKDLVSESRIQKGLYWQKAWSLVEGCSYVSEACQNCWAASQAHMRSHQGNEKMQRRYKGLTTPDGKWNGKIRMLSSNIQIPSMIKKPTLFCIWNDLFHPDVSAKFINAVFEVMMEAQQHFFLCLTKRPENIIKFMNQIEDYDSHDFPNLGFGVTVEMPKYLRRVKTLLQIPAAMHFVSLEPLLDKVSVQEFMPAMCHYESIPHTDCLSPDRCDCNCHACRTAKQFEHEKLRWVIIGCESGRKNRPASYDAVYNIMKECHRAEVPVFIKQLEQNGKVVKAPEFAGKQRLQFPDVEWKL